VDTYIVVENPNDGNLEIPRLPDELVPAPPGGCQWLPACQFNEIASGQWIALPMPAPTIRFDGLNTTRFTAVSYFPTAMFVDVAGNTHGPFPKGGSFSFAGLPGGSVTSFSLQPDTSSIPALAPIGIALDGASGSFQAQVIGPAEVTVACERVSAGAAPSGDSPLAVGRGETIRFSAQTSGNCANTYQWSFNSVPLPGETGPTITIGGVGTEHYGDYSVVVQNGLGNAVSPSLRIEPLLYTLTVNVPAGTVERSPDQTAYEPGTVVIVQALPPTGQFFVAWTGDIAGTANPVSVSLDRNTTITARYGSPFGGTPWAVPGRIQAGTSTRGAKVWDTTMPMPSIRVAAAIAPAGWIFWNGLAARESAGRQRGNGWITL
jgi:hypothetical protein